MIIQFCQNLFSVEAQPTSGVHMDASFPFLEPKLLEDTFKSVFCIDVRNAIFDMGALKAPGIDGLPVGFFQKH